MAYRGAVCSQKGSPRVHWVLRKIASKIKGLKQEIRKIIAFVGKYDRPTDRRDRGRLRYSSAGSVLSCDREFVGSELQFASVTSVSGQTLFIPFDGAGNVYMDHTLN